MPRFPKPFFRDDRGLWYVQIEGKQHNLGRDKGEAFRRYHLLMQAPKPVASTLASVVRSDRQRQRVFGSIMRWK